MKGVLICGGSGTRLRPLTEITNKSLLPVYDKPLILYPLNVLLRAGIREIVIVSGPEHIDQMEKFLGSGERFGCTFHFVMQAEPKGIAQALGLAEPYAAGESICALLGDNIFFDDLSHVIQTFEKGCHLFLKEVHDPERFGVATCEKKDGIISVTNIEEKPKEPKTNSIVTGCYVYDQECFNVIRTLKPSKRGEIEISDLNQWYVEQQQAYGTQLEKEWIDAGTFESLFRAAEMVRKEKLSTSI